MPESPVMEMDLKIELPAPAQDVPLRDGEERFLAAMNIEDQRRRESTLRELVAEFKRMSGSSAEVMLTKYASSPTAKARQVSVRRKLEELKKLTFKRGDRWEGPCAPFTVINLNPVPLSLVLDGTERFMIPRCGGGRQINLTFRGRSFVGSYLTLDKPYLWGAHTGTHSDRQTGVDMPKLEYNYIPPAGLAHQFFAHYVHGANDAQGMGGILLFEGDIHTLEPKQMKASNGTIWVPKMEVTLEGFGDAVYVVEAMELNECMERALTLQKDYADKQITEGHGFSISQSDIIRNQLSNYHRVWHNFAFDHSYITEKLPWAVERMKDGPRTVAVNCPDCHTRQTSPDQYMCPNCNSPFDAFKAYMAGKTVSPDKLAMYDEDSAEWQAIVKENARRKARIAILDLGEAPAARETAAQKKAREKAESEAKAATS